SESVEGHLCRFAIAAEYGQLAAALEDPRGNELGFEPLVSQNRVAPSHIQQVERTHVMHVPGAERQAGPVVRTIEELMPVESAVDGKVFHLVHQPFAQAQYVRMQVLEFLCLGLLDSLEPGGLGRLLRDDG